MNDSTNMGRKCSLCGTPAGKGKAELRPYGKGGADVCAGCVLGNPEREAVARKHLSTRLMARGPLVLNPREHTGPRPMTAQERHRLVGGRK